MFVRSHGSLQCMPLIGTPPVCATAVQRPCLNALPFDRTKCAGHVSPSTTLLLCSVKLASLLPKPADTAATSVEPRESATNANPPAGPMSAAKLETVVGRTDVDEKGQLIKSKSSEHVPNE